jgi:DNA-binding NarL/FixJ family response regulator
MTPVRDILLVDDHPIIVLAVKSIIESRSKDYRIRTASTAAEAIEMAREVNPWLAILDLSLPDGDGMVLIQDIRAECSDCRVLIFSMQNELKYGPRALKAGANGYLMKGEQVSAVVDAIKTIEGGRIYCSPELSDHLMRSFGKTDQSSLIDILSEREFQIFKLLGEGRGGREIAASLHISPKTVDSHRENMKVKLQCATMRELAFFAHDWAQSQPISSELGRAAGGGHK